MAKGKQAAASANKRYSAALEHIDRLTEELAATKIRARDAERRADRLEGIEAHLEKSSVKNDELVVALTDANKSWQKIAKADARRRKAAVLEMFDRVAHDVADIPGGLAPADRYEMLRSRYPAIWKALRATDEIAEDPVLITNRSTVRGAEKLSRESLIRFQRLTGDRGDLRGKFSYSESSKLFADVLEAKQAGFSEQEILELVAAP